MILVDFFKILSKNVGQVQSLIMDKDNGEEEKKMTFEDYLDDKEARKHRGDAMAGKGRKVEDDLDGEGLSDDEDGNTKAMIEPQG